MASPLCRLLALVALAISPSLAWAGPRLGADVLPYEYRLELRPDLRSETFVVDETIRVRVSEPVSTITLHAADLEVERSSVRSREGKQRPAVEIDPEAQLLRLRLEQPIGPGEAEIRLTLRGRIARTLRGLYLSESGGRRYAFTQFQPADARRMFACFDEPAIKAQFDLIVAVDARASAISNGRVVSVLPGLVPGTKRVRFERTPPISTYMLALAVGEFDCLTDRAGATQLRLCGQPEKVALGRYALSTAKRSLEYFEDYTGIDYPFDKLDLVAVPDFSPGAMENPGAIFFREGSGLIDPDRAPAETRRWVAAIIAHEVAHMWVGNLVTARWWDDLWLNEGLATWLTRKSLSATHPELEARVAGAQATIKALELDALEGSRAPRSPVDDPGSVVELFDPITNDKPAEALSMAEAMAGEEAVRRGLRRYLVAWSWGAASTEDFLSAIEPETGSAVAGAIRDFVTRPGYPKVVVDSRCEGGREVATVTQRPVRESLRSAGPWTLPLCFRPLPAGSETCTILRDEPVVIDTGVCGSAVVINPRFAGFYRTEYGRGTAGRLLAEGASTLAQEERIMLLDSEWSAFREGARGVGDVLEIAGAVISTDPSAAVLGQIAMQLWSMHESVADEGELEPYRRWVARMARSGAGRAAEGAAEEAKRKLDAELAWIGGVIGDDAEIRARGLAFARDYLRDPWKERKVNVDVMLAAAARTGDAELYDSIEARLRKTRIEQERYRLIWAIGFFGEPALVDRTLGLAVDGTVRSQDAATLIARLLSRRETSERAWQFVRDEWPTLRQKLPPGFTSDRIVRAAGSFCGAARRAEVESFFSSPDAPAAPRALAASLASIDACIALRERNAGQLGAWLSARDENH